MRICVVKLPSRAKYLPHDEHFGMRGKFRVCIEDATSGERRYGAEEKKKPPPAGGVCSVAIPDSSARRMPLVCLVKSCT